MKKEKDKKKVNIGQNSNELQQVHFGGIYCVRLFKVGVGGVIFVTP